MIQGTIILEGGAKRGIFTSGVLDYLIEKDTYFSDVIGVSMGACNALGYVAGQRERTKNCIIIHNREDDYVNGPIRMLRKKSLMDMDMIFNEFPYKIHPFDFAAYFQSPMNCEIVATNCLTGAAEYLSEKQDEHRLMQITRASSSLPLLSQMTPVDETPYLDGGLADSLPLKRAMAIGNKKIVLVLTRNYGYRKEPTKKGLNRMYRKMYKEYPALLKTLQWRNEHYNQALTKIEQLELAGQIFVIRPQVHPVSRLEPNNEKLERFYQHGYEQMRERYDELQEFLYS